MRLSNDDKIFDSIGYIIKRVSESNVAISILNSDPQTRGGTFKRGGCANLAYAVHQILSGSEIRGIVRDNGNGIVDHIIVKPSKYYDLYLDADGCSGGDDLIMRWSNIVKNPIISPIVRENLGKIPYSEVSIRRYKCIFESIIQNSSIIQEIFNKHSRLQL